MTSLGRPGHGRPRSPTTDARAVAPTLQPRAARPGPARHDAARDQPGLPRRGRRALPRRPASRRRCSRSPSRASRSVLLAVAAGAGPAILPVSVAERYAMPGVRLVPLDAMATPRSSRRCSRIPTRTTLRPAPSCAPRCISRHRDPVSRSSAPAVRRCASRRDGRRPLPLSPPFLSPPRPRRSPNHAPVRQQRPLHHHAGQGPVQAPPRRSGIAPARRPLSTRGCSPRPTRRSHSPPGAPRRTPRSRTPTRRTSPRSTARRTRRPCSSIACEASGDGRSEPRFRCSASSVTRGSRCAAEGRRRCSWSSSATSGRVWAAKALASAPLPAVHALARAPLTTTVIVPGLQRARAAVPPRAGQRRREPARSS